MARRIPQTITQQEFDRLLRQPSRRAPTGVRNAAILAVMWDAGLRVSEVCALAPADVKDGTIRVRRGKGGSDRANLGVPTGTWALLERWRGVRPSSRWFFCTLGGNQLSPRYVQAMTSRYSRKAGVFLTGDENERRPVHPHALRHSYATRLVEAGVPIHDVQRALGHRSLGTTQVYLHVNDAKLAARLREALEVSGNGDDAETAALRRIVREELELIVGAKR